MVWFWGNMIINNSANLKLYYIYRPLVTNILTDYNFDLFTQVQTFIWVWKCQWSLKLLKEKKQQIEIYVFKWLVQIQKATFSSISLPIIQFWLPFCDVPGIKSPNLNPTLHPKITIHILQTLFSALNLFLNKFIKIMMGFFR